MEDATPGIDSLKTTTRTLQSTRSHLRDQDIDSAIDAAAGLADETDCRVCERIETHVLALLAAIKHAPPARRADHYEFAANELDFYIGRYERQLKEVDARA